jgi:hypothetical protein
MILLHVLCIITAAATTTAGRHWRGVNSKGLVVAVRLLFSTKCGVTQT